MDNATVKLAEAVQSLAIAVEEIMTGLEHQGWRAPEIRRYVQNASEQAREALNA